MAQACVRRARRAVARQRVRDRADGRLPRRARDLHRVVGADDDPARDGQRADRPAGVAGPVGRRRACRRCDPASGAGGRFGRGRLCRRGHAQCDDGRNDADHRRRDGGGHPRRLCGPVPEADRAHRRLDRRRGAGLADRLQPARRARRQGERAAPGRTAGGGHRLRRGGHAQRGRVLPGHRRAGRHRAAGAAGQRAADAASDLDRALRGPAQRAARLRAHAVACGARPRRAAAGSECGLPAGPRAGAQRRVARRRSGRHRQQPRRAAGRRARRCPVRAHPVPLSRRARRGAGNAGDAGHCHFGGRPPPLGAIAAARAWRTDRHAGAICGLGGRCNRRRRRAAGAGAGRGDNPAGLGVRRPGARLAVVCAVGADRPCAHRCCDRATGMARRHALDGRLGPSRARNPRGSALATHLPRPRAAGRRRRDVLVRRAYRLPGRAGHRRRGADLGALRGFPGPGHALARRGPGLDPARPLAGAARRRAVGRGRSGRRCLGAAHLGVARAPGAPGLRGGGHGVAGVCLRGVDGDLQHDLRPSVTRRCGADQRRRCRGHRLARNAGCGTAAGASLTAGCGSGAAADASLGLCGCGPAGSVRHRSRDHRRGDHGLGRLLRQP